MARCDRSFHTTINWAYLAPEGYVKQDASNVTEINLTSPDLHWSSLQDLISMCENLRKITYEPYDVRYSDLECYTFNPQAIL